MPCIFSARGKNFDVDKFLVRTTLEPSSVCHRGEPISRLKPKGGKRPFSGFSQWVSDDGWRGFDKQVKDSLKFLQNHEQEIRRLSRFPALERLGLDFGVAWKSKNAAQFYVFPPELCLLAGKLSVELEISVYQFEIPKKRAKNT